MLDWLFCCLVIMCFFCPQLSKAFEECLVETRTYSFLVVVITILLYLCSCDVSMGSNCVVDVFWALCCSGLNPRFQHTFVDEDAVGWCKLIASRTTQRKKIEDTLMRSARLRLLTLKWRARKLNTSANKRALRWKVSIALVSQTWVETVRSSFFVRLRKRHC